MIHLTITGNLAADPKCELSDNGKPWCALRLLVTHRIHRDGQWRDGETRAFDVIAFADLAVTAGSCLTKGNRVTVLADDIQPRAWTDRDGHPAAGIRLRATEITASLRGQNLTITKANPKTAAAGLADDQATQHP